MALDITSKVLDEFKRITSCDVRSILQDAQTFLSTSYNRIVAYYSGDATQASQADFIAFANLQREIKIVFSVFRTQNQAFNNLKWWLLLDHIEDIDSRLSSLAVINKWSKSSFTNFGYNPSQQAIYTTKAKQTLERVAFDILNDPNPQDDWIDIALNNQIREEDYTVNGGTPLQLSFPNINHGIDITTVVDVMVDKNILGKDFQKKIQYDADTNDLVVLDPDDTVEQTLLILATLRQNDQPDFPDLGLQSAVVVGGNRASLNFPIITRQYNNTFASDDSLKNFQLQSLQVVEDNLTISYQVSTRLNETKSGVVAIGK